MDHYGQGGAGMTTPATYQGLGASNAVPPHHGNSGTTAERLTAQGALGQTDQLLEKAHGLVTELEQRLGLILAPVPSDGVNAKQSAPTSPNIVDRLIDQARSLEALSHRIVVLTNRVQL